MTDARAKELIDDSDKIFAIRQPMLNLWQDISEICYPQRAEFLTQHHDGEDFLGLNQDSFPSMCRRELGNSMSAMLRPRNQDWFRCTTEVDEIDEDEDNARYLDYVTSRVRRGIYHPKAKFISATKLGDHDFVTFGNAVISVEEIRPEKGRPHLFFRAFHLRDCAWLDNKLDEVTRLDRKDTMTARVMVETFGAKNVDEKVRKASEKEPAKPVNLRVIVKPSHEYDYKPKSDKGGKRGTKLPYTVCYIDADNTKVMREGGLIDFPYVVPRWHRLGRLPYAFSDATMTAFPDSRMAQEFAVLMLEATEKAVYPPILAREEAITQANFQSGSITWADLATDQKLEEAAKPFRFESNMTVAFEFRKDLREVLSKAFFIDKLRLPEATKEMTATEVRERLEEHVRNLLPLFEPMEVEYNTRLLDKAFILLRNMNVFDLETMPDDLSKANIGWSFRNPLQEANVRLLVAKGRESLEIDQAAEQMGLTPKLNRDKVFRDMIRGVDGPADWRKSAAEEAADMKEMETRKRLAGAAQEIAAAGQVAGAAGEGIQQLQAAGVLPAPQQQVQGKGPVPGQKMLPAPKPQVQQAA